jgi:iron complex outermembrane receptor protein
VTWHGAVTYEPTRSNLLYAKVDTGYKSGGFTSVSRYGPESLTAYEVGSKNRFAGNRVEFNIDGFYYDYRDLQVSQYRADGLSSITNAGKARIWGIETEAAFMPTPADRLNLTVNYLDAKYVDFSVASGGPTCPIMATR